MTNKDHPPRKVIAACLVAICSAIAICICATRAEAEPNTDRFGGVNFAYSTWVGTGYYRLGDRTSLILRGRWAVPLHESQAQRKWELGLLLEGTIGFYDIFTDVTDVAAITAMPGLILEYPVRENWWLKPFVQIGFGKDFSGGDTALIGAAGIKSLAAFSRANGAVWELGNSLIIADNSRSDENPSDEGFSFFEIGINRRSPITYRVLDQAAQFNLFFIYTQFISDIEFYQVDFRDSRLKQIYKFGFPRTRSSLF